MMARNTISSSIPVVNSIIVTVVPITTGIILSDEGIIVLDKEGELAVREGVIKAVDICIMENAIGLFIASLYYNNNYYKYCGPAIITTTIISQCKKQ